MGLIQSYSLTGDPSHTQKVPQLINPFELTTSSSVVELCLARAAKTTVVLTNSENTARDTEKSVQSVVEPVSAWRANHDGSKQRDVQRRKFFEAIALHEGPVQSTNSRGNQFEAGEWLPECDIAREKNCLAPKSQLQTIDKECTSVNFLD